MRGGSGNFRNGRVPKMGLGLFLKWGEGGGGVLTPLRTMVRKRSCLLMERHEIINF